jgi:two-component system sensor histidine kinase AlgZ
LIRARPQQAEAALESLSDLFRAAMRDPSELVSLADEIALGQQYLELEKLRLGERLTVDWKIDGNFSNIPIPPLMLQPLLENAVYHGIEPAADGGLLEVSVERRGEELIIVITNPTAGQSQHAAGNHMALANIRERLALYYDLEARLDILAGADRYEVRITLPCQVLRP